MKAATPAKERLYALGRLKPGAMNRTEAAYAQRLELALRAGEIQWWRFEGIKLRLADNTFLTVDFSVLRKDGLLEMVEVKGGRAVFQDDAKAKIKVAAEMFPFVFKVAYPEGRPGAVGLDWVVEEF